MPSHFLSNMSSKPQQPSVQPCVATLARRHVLFLISVPQPRMTCWMHSMQARCMGCAACSLLMSCCTGCGVHYMGLGSAPLQHHHAMGFELTRPVYQGFDYKTVF